MMIPRVSSNVRVLDLNIIRKTHVFRLDVFAEDIGGVGVAFDPNVAATIEHKRRLVLSKGWVRRCATQRIAAKRQSANRPRKENRIVERLERIVLNANVSMKRLVGFTLWFERRMNRYHGMAPIAGVA